MRIVHVLDSASRLAGGMSESVKGFSRATSAGEDEVIVLAGSGDAAEIDLSAWSPIVPRKLPSGGVANGVLGHALTAALIEARPDLVHVHGLWGVAARATAAWVTRTQGAVVVSPHGMLDPWALRRSARKKGLSRLFWEGRLLQRARFLHALNAAEAEAIAAAGWTRPVVTIPNGVDLPERLSARNGADGRRTMLFIGRLHPKKGIEELVRAWAKLPPVVRSGWCLKIAGWDEIGLLAGLVELCRSLGVQDDIAFVGAVFGAEKDALFRSAAAFILPSHSEGLPIAVLEAWAYALPVFMTAACNLPQGFASNAAIEIETTPDAMAAVLAAALIEPDHLVRTGALGRNLVERDHAWSAIAQQMRAAYARAGL